MTPVTVLLLAAAVLALPTGRSSAERVRPRRDGPEEQEGNESRADPLAIAAAYDLLAASLRSGLPMPAAAAAVAASAPPLLAAVLRRAADLLSLGADPATAWAAAAEHPETESLARMARRSARSGAPVAAAMAELATAARTAAEDAAAAKAERAGVLISGPLGLCFLPAFICLGIVPLVIGLAQRTLGDGVL